MALRLGIPLQELQDKTTSQEFIMWLEYLDKEVHEFHREDWYMAQIASEIRRGIVSNPRSVKLKDFILKFTGGSEAARNPMSSKKTWLSIFGIKEKKNG